MLAGQLVIVLLLISYFIVSFIIPIIIIVQVFGIKKTQKRLESKIDSIKNADVAPKQNLNIKPKDETSVEAEQKTKTDSRCNIKPEVKPEVKLEVKPEVKLEITQEPDEVQTEILKPSLKTAGSSMPPEEKTVLDKKLDDLAEKTNTVISRMWSWLCVGEEFRNPSVSTEYAIATTWLVRIGVLILLFGFGFFIKYSIDRNWITPVVRIGSMGALGLILAAGGAAAAKTKYRPVATGLSGAGFALMYLAIGAAYMMYSLLPGVQAFALACIVTIAGMTTAVLTNALIIAMIATIAGYFTPVAISTGSNDPLALLAYFAVLGGGTLAISKYRSWEILHVISLILYGLIGITGAWALATQENLIFVLALLALNSFIFAIQCVIRRNGSQVSIIELILLSINALIYIGAITPLAEKFGYGEIKLPAMMMLGAAAAGFGLYVYSITHLKKEIALQTFLLVTTAVPLAATVPLLFNGAWIMFAWSVLSLGFVYASVENRSKTLLTLACILFGFTFLRGIVLESGNWHAKEYLDALVNHLLTFGVYTLSLLLSGALLLTEKARSLFTSDRGIKKAPLTFASSCAYAFMFIAGLIFFVYSTIELYDCMDFYAKSFGGGIVVMWWTLIALALAAAGYLKNIKTFYGAATFVYIIIAGYFFVAPKPYMTCQTYPREFLYHLLTIGLYIASLTAYAVLMQSFAKRKARMNDSAIANTAFKNATILFSVAGILFFTWSSCEIYNALDNYLRLFRNGGVSVWWAVIAITVLFNGIRFRIKTLRMTGIFLFAACAAKVFFVDLASLQQIWRIAAFIVTGAIMIGGAILYIRFKDRFETDAGK